MLKAKNNFQSKGILKRLIPELRRFNEVIGIFGDDVDAEMKIRFK